jgi:hypothetical protein
MQHFYRLMAEALGDLAVVLPRCHHRQSRLLDGEPTRLADPASVHRVFACPT